MKIAVSGERLGHALPSTLNISINYFRPVSVKVRVCVGRRARNLALTNTTCVYVGMGDMYQLILHVCLGRGHALVLLCV